MNHKLPLNVTVELLKHMSEEGRFEQTLGDFPDLDLEEVRETFSWLADQFKKQIDDAQPDDTLLIKNLSRKKMISETTERVLEELSPQETRALLRNFGALD